MASTIQQVILVTGANRGIGHAVTTQLALQDNVFVVAAVRDPAKPSSSALAELPHGKNSRVVIVQIDSKSETDAAKAVEQLQKDHGVSKIDVVLANAGVSCPFAPLAEAKVQDLRDLVETNALGPFILFQATLPLLQKAENPRFALIGSAVGSIGGMEKRPYPMFTYGASKAMAHYMVRKIHFEHSDIVAFTIDPGFVQSETGNEGARRFGMTEAPVTLVDSSRYIVKQIDEATKETHSGRFPSFEGGFFEW